MNFLQIVSATACTFALAMSAATAAPPEGKGGGKGGGGEEPPAEPFVPAIAYFESNQKSKGLKLANRAGDQACLVLQSNTGEPKLMGFVYHAATKKLAHSTSGVGIRLATWDDDPCEVTSGAPIPQTGTQEFMDFSPDGKFLTWAEGDPNYSGFGSSYIISIYEVATGRRTKLNLKQWGGSRPEWGVDGEWAAAIVHFSPDFVTSKEIIFSGGPLDGSLGAYDSIFIYNIDETSAPRKLHDGGGEWISPFMSVTNPEGVGGARVAIDKGLIRQIAISNGSEGPTIEGGEPAYSCDNTEVIYKRPSSRGGKNEILIVSAEDPDGSLPELWSKADLRFFDWFCP